MLATPLNKLAPFVPSPLVGDALGVVGFVLDGVDEAGAAVDDLAGAAVAAPAEPATAGVGVSPNVLKR